MAELPYPSLWEPTAPSRAKSRSSPSASPALFQRYSGIMTVFISLWTMFITYDIASAACS